MQTLGAEDAIMLDSGSSVQLPEPRLCCPRHQVCIMCQHIRTRSRSKNVQTHYPSDILPCTCWKVSGATERDYTSSCRGRSLQVAEAAQDADQVRGGVLRAGRPGVQAHHKALAY
jgi:hypothetical protein